MDRIKGAHGTKFAAASILAHLVRVAAAVALAVHSGKFVTS